MSLSDFGRPTHHTRVERWECDYNDHWNVRFYARSFELASAAVARSESSRSAPATVHIRFHKELRVSAPVEIRTARIVTRGPWDGAMVHLMLSQGELAATALDRSGSGSLPEIAPEIVPLAMPRSLAGVADFNPPANATITHCELGPIQPSDIDHRGRVQLETLLRFSSVTQHFQLNSLGFTPAYSDKSRINRMGVEFRITMGELVLRPGQILHAETWFSDIRRKTIFSVLRILTESEVLIAAVEQCIVTVDIDKRQAVPVPDFLRSTL